VERTPGSFTDAQLRAGLVEPAGLLGQSAHALGISGPAGLLGHERLDGTASVVP
jgi:hypothetical protein